MGSIWILLNAKWVSRGKADARLVFDPSCCCCSCIENDQDRQYRQPRKHCFFHRHHLAKSDFDGCRSPQFMPGLRSLQWLLQSSAKKIFQACRKRGRCCRSFLSSCRLFGWSGVGRIRRPFHLLWLVRSGLKGEAAQTCLGEVEPSQLFRLITCRDLFFLELNR